MRPVSLRRIESWEKACLFVLLGCEDVKTKVWAEIRISNIYLFLIRNKKKQTPSCQKKMQEKEKIKQKTNWRVHSRKHFRIQTCYFFIIAMKQMRN